MWTGFESATELRYLCQIILTSVFTFYTLCVRAHACPHVCVCMHTCAYGRDWTQCLLPTRHVLYRWATPLTYTIRFVCFLTALLLLFCMSQDFPVPTCICTCLHTHTDFIILEFRVKELTILFPVICQWGWTQKPPYAEKWFHGFSFSSQTTNPKKIPRPQVSLSAGLWNTAKVRESCFPDNVWTWRVPQFEVYTREGHTRAPEVKEGHTEVPRWHPVMFKELRLPKGHCPLFRKKNKPTERVK